MIRWQRRALRVGLIETCKLNFAPGVLNTSERLLECANSSDSFAMNKQNRKTHLFEIDRAARTTRRTKPHTVKQIHITEKRSTGEKIRRNHQYETTIEDAETRQVVMQAAQFSSEQLNFIKANSEVGNLKMKLLRKRCNVTSGEEVMSKVYRSKKLRGDTCRQLVRSI